MPAPKRLILHVDRTHLSAFILPMMDESEAREVTCRECSPIRTKMKFYAEVVTPERPGQSHYYVVRCAKCGRYWAAPFHIVNYEGSVS